MDLAKAAGCEVIACGSADWKLDLLREQGADHVIDTSQTDFFDFVKEKFGKPRILGGGGVDVVINYIGGDTWVKSMKCLKKNGRLLTCGATAVFNPTEDIRFIWSFELNVMGSNGWYPNDQVRLMDDDQSRLFPRLQSPCSRRAERSRGKSRPQPTASRRRRRVRRATGTTHP